MYLTEIQVLGEAPNVDRVEAALHSREVTVVAGRGVANALKEHFLALNEARHGGYSTVGFYEQAADQVFGAEDDAIDYGDAIGVGTTKIGMALRRWGKSPLLPRDRAYLAIPNYDFLSVTHGRSPLEFTNLRVVFGRQETGDIGPVGLAADDGGAAFETSGKKVRLPSGEYTIKGSAKTQSSEGEVLFWLKKFVFMQADESVLPSDAALSLAGQRAAMLYLESLGGRN